MTAFLKFCGGCNEKYNRGAVSGMLKKTFEEDITFMNHDGKTPCDLGIIISGCDTECVKEKDLAPAKLYVRVNSMEGIAGAIKEIRNFISK